MLFAKTKSYLGVDIGAGGVKVVELKKEKGRPVLFTYGYSTGKLPIGDWQKTAGQGGGDDLDMEDVQAAQPARGASTASIKIYIEAIMEVCRRAKIASKTAVVSLPVSSVFHALVTLPQSEKEEFDEMLKTEVKKLLPRPVDEMALDYQLLPVPPGAKVKKAIVNAVPRELVDFYSAIFHKTGLFLDSLEPESSALCRVLVGKDAGVNMLVDMGAERTNFFITDQGYPVTHHSIEIGGNDISRILGGILGAEEAEVEQIKNDVFSWLNRPGNLAASETSRWLEIFSSILEPIIKEIEYDTELFLRQTGNEGKRVEKIILTGGASFWPGLSQYISERFQVKCYVGDPWSRVVYQDSLRPLLRQLGPRLAVAIGLAMRSIV